MKLFLFILFFTVQTCFSQYRTQVFVSEDISNFWNAYERITSTNDSARKIELLHNLYLDKATPGLSALIQARNYTSNDFIEAIQKYPKFWASIRGNTLSVRKYETEIIRNIQQLKEAYPELKPATIYFSVGAFRTNGAAQGNKVLIGSELALADSSTIISELPKWRQAYYREYKPLEKLALLCTHEYIHTQQNSFVDNLLSICLYEGVAEFLSCMVTGEKSSVPAIEFGKENADKVLKKFVEDLFTKSNDNNWIWGENQNDLKVRDLGYYIGYEICQRYYNSATDKKQAVKELIKLDYSNQEGIERIVNGSKLLPKSVTELYEDYERKRPTVISMTPFHNNIENAPLGVTKITVKFSAPLNGYNTGIDFGPLGKSAMPRVNAERTWSNDATEWTFEADLKSGTRYQILISDNFRTSEGIRLKPYLIDIKTR